MIEILHRYTGAVLYASGSAKTVADAVKEAVANGADLHGADLRGANLAYANLRGANLAYANLDGADLYGANLRYADLRYADIRYADIRYADLRYADLHGADIRYADLRYADLRYADLYGANLDGADLYEANLRGADLRNVRLDAAMGVPKQQTAMKPRPEDNPIPARRQEPATFARAEHQFAQAKKIVGTLSEGSQHQTDAGTSGSGHLAPALREAQPLLTVADGGHRR